MRTTLVGLMVGVLLFSSPARADFGGGPPSYIITDLGALLPANTSSQAHGVNDSGVVVGGAFNLQSGGSAIQWTSGSFTPLPIFSGDAGGTGYEINSAGVVAGATGNSAQIQAVRWVGGALQSLNITGLRSQANGINDSGKIVGYYNLLNNGVDDQAFLWNSGSYITLGSLGGRQTVANAINNAGMVAGSSESANLSTRAFVWSDANANQQSDPGEMVQLPDYGLSSAAYGISELGVAAGFALRTNFTREASLWVNGVRTPLPNFISDTGAEAWAVNSSGWAVGESTSPGGRALLWFEGTAYALTSLIPSDAGWARLSNAYDISEQGHIIGIGRRTLTGDDHAFLMTLIPEPAAVAPAATLLVFMRRRARDFKKM